MMPPNLTWFAHTTPMMNPSLIRHGVASWSGAHFLLALDITRSFQRDLLVNLLTPCCLAKGEPLHGRGLRCQRCMVLHPVEPDVASLIFIQKHSHTDETWGAAEILDSWLANYGVDPLEQVIAAHELVSLFRSAVNTEEGLDLPRIKTDEILERARNTIAVTA